MKCYCPQPHFHVPIGRTFVLDLIVLSMSLSIYFWGGSLKNMLLNSSHFFPLKTCYLKHFLYLLLLISTLWFPFLKLPILWSFLNLFCQVSKLCIVITNTWCLKEISCNNCYYYTDSRTQIAVSSELSFSIHFEIYISLWSKSCLCTLFKNITDYIEIIYD